MRETLRAYCERMQLCDLLAQWDASRNLPLTPDTVSYGSKRKVWWHCSHGHSWQAAVFTRTTGSGCPVCSGKRPKTGENDLATRYPALARQWHPEKNGALTPEMVTSGSHRTVWWRCEQGHEWCAPVKSRASGSGCPVCASRAVLPGKKDLASRFPAIAAEWHPTRNNGLLPSEIVPGSHRKVWWLCEKGHAWQAQVSSRTGSGSGCPVCSGKRVLPGENDLASQFPAIAAEWHPTQNGALVPQQVSPYSNRKVWWQCALGHTYHAAIAARTTNGSGCPYCAGRKVLPGFNDLATLAPDIAKQWHPTLNGTLTPRMVTIGTQKKVWWQCLEGHVWQAIVFSRTGAKKCGCPICAGRISAARRKKYQFMLMQAAETRAK